MLKKQISKCGCKRLISSFTAVFCILNFCNLSYCADEFLLQCLKIAQARDPKLAAAKQQISLAETRTINAARAFFPQMSLQHTNSKGSTALAQTGSDVIADSYEYQSQEYGVKVSQPIYEGYKTRGMYEYETMMVTVAKYSYTKEREELFSKIKIAYYEYLTGRKEYLYLKEAFEIIEGLLVKVNNEYKAKAISQLDLLEAENFRDKTSNLFSTSRTGLSYSLKKLLETVRAVEFNEIPSAPLTELPDDVPEINFTLKELLNFVGTNSIEVQTAKIQTEMADMKIKISRSKVKPKFYVEGFYGKSGEAFTTERLELTTTWNVAGKLAWGLWGSSLEASYSNEKADPTTIVDASRRIDTKTYDIKLNLLDDISYFVDSKESVVSFNQANADYLNVLSERKLELEKNYNQYLASLGKARALRKEIIFRGRKVALMKKRNDLYEVTTQQLMDETWQYAEAISNYAKAMLENYSAVTEMERITLMILR
jgi:outer membrane protein TolC